jgi:ABC-type nitrate/sulfonate/bicarbonate transport system substrate-binding protein
MTEQPRLRRRAALAGAGTVAACVALPRFAIGQGLRKLGFTTSWLPEGPNLFAYVARDRGFWRQRGLDVSVARGSGSGAAAQVVGAGRFDFGMSATPTVIQQAAQGLPLVCIAQLNYDAMMGIGVLAESPIRAPRDLEGRSLGSSVGSGEYPFLPLYAQKAGVDLARVKQVLLDAKVRERALVEKQVDAISSYATSTIPSLVSEGTAVRFLLYSAAGIEFYGQSLIAQPQRLADHGLVQAFVDGALEAVRFTMTNFDEAVDTFLKANDEVAMSHSGAEYARLGLGLTIATNLVPELKDHGFGWADPAKVRAMAETVVQYSTKPGTAVPDLGQLFTNDFAGHLALDAAGLAKAEAAAQPYRRYLG